MDINIHTIEIIKSFNQDINVINEEQFKPIKWVKPINNADTNSLVFIDKKAKSKSELLNNTAAKVIICDFIPESEELYNDKCLLVCMDPKLQFTKLVNHIINNGHDYIIHPTAVIHPDAKVHAKCYIGPYTIVGKCTINEGTIIYGNSQIYDDVTIGKNVIIDSGVVIGAAGFGFVRDEEGVPYRFPQLGGVTIEDDVEIGANTCIDRGALQNTIIRRGVKIDNMVQIAHNDDIGEYTYIMANCTIAGSVKIGRKCWIAPSFIMNKVTIGDNVTVGFGANVLKSIKDNQVVLGNPATDLDKYARLQFKLKNL